MRTHTLRYRSRADAVHTLEGLMLRWYLESLQSGKSTHTVQLVKYAPDDYRIVVGAVAARR